MITDEEWRRRFLARLQVAGHPNVQTLRLVAMTEVAEMRATLGNDPERAADTELVYSGGHGPVQ